MANTDMQHPVGGNRGAVRRKRWWHAIIVAAIGFALPSVAAATAMLQYRAHIDGVDDRGLRRRLEFPAVTLRQRKGGVRDAEILAWRAGRDAEMMRNLLLADGFRQASVSVSVTEREAKIPLVLRFRVDPGPLYTVRAVEIDIEDLPPENRPRDIHALAAGLQGRPARTDAILRVETLMKEALRASGHAAAEIRPRRVVVSHPDQHVAIRYSFRAGPLFFIGATHIEGLKRVRPRAVLRKLPWHEGGRYDARELELGRERLLDSGLFSSVRVQEMRDAEDDLPNPLPVVLRLTERRRRGVGLGLHYYSDEGLGTRAFWEHRNWRGHGERLRLDVRRGRVLSDFRSQITLPDFRRFEQQLFLRFQRAIESTDVYDSRRWDTELGVDRRLNRRLSVGAGMGFLIAEAWQRGDDRMEYDLFYFPLRVTFDATDSRLHPTRGTRTTGRVVPFVDLRNPPDAAQFFKTQAQIEGHQPLVGRDRLGVSTRLSAGSILRAPSMARVPVDQRFYAGGGGSVRGYAYQSLGPRRNDRPTGGISMVEISAELRSRWTENIGGVLFMDAGSVYSTLLPNDIDPLRWSAGLGVRWFTGMGPLRVDLAFPLQQREGIDDPFVVYIGLGQAF